MPSALQVHLCPSRPGGTISGSQRWLLRPARLILGPIGRLPAAKQTPVLKEMGFRQQMYRSSRSLEQCSDANCFPLLVTVAKCNGWPAGDRLCALLVLWKYRVHLPDFRKECLIGECSAAFLFITHRTPFSVATPHFYVWVILVKRKATLQNSSWLITNFI